VKERGGGCIKIARQRYGRDLLRVGIGRTDGSRSGFCHTVNLLLLQLHVTAESNHSRNSICAWRRSSLARQPITL